MASNYIWSIKAPYSFFVASHKGFYQKGNPKHENGMAEWVSYSVKTKVKRRSMIKVSAIRVALFFFRNTLVGLSNCKTASNKWAKS